MTAPWEQAKALQRPLRDGMLEIVVRGVKKDDPSDAALFPAVKPRPRALFSEQPIPRGWA